MPDAVEAAGYCRYRCEEGVSHPYRQHSVFLSQRLSARYSVVVCSAHLASQPELQQAADERGGHQAKLCCQGHVGMYNGACRGGHGQRERHGPEIEAQVAVVGYREVEPWRKISQQDGSQQGQEQQREHLAEDEHGRVHYAQLRTRVHIRHQCRYECRRDDVYQYGVCGYVVDVSAQFLCYHRAGRGRRAYQAYHGAFEHNAQSVARHEHECHGYGRGRAGLEEQQPRMPLAQAELLGVHLAECDKQHGEDQHRLQQPDGFEGKVVSRLQRGYCRVDEVGGNAGDDGDY